ncbi:MAG: hypothetical protein IPM26_04195 [Saprospiraceae bacterium]|nr:hypothetical protein [Saprospiraceae bacterium]
MVLCTYVHLHDECSIPVQFKFHKDFGCTGVDMLYEDSSYYYVIGYAQAKDKVEVGVMVNKHNKKSGALTHSAYFDVENVWLGYGSRPGVIQKNNNLYFCLSGTDGVVYIMNYNTMTQDITVKESIITKSGYVYDLVVDDEGNMYCSYTTKMLKIRFRVLLPNSGLTVQNHITPLITKG